MAASTGSVRSWHRMADVAIISANYGSYDVAKAALPQEGIDAEWILVTDDLSMSDGTGGWHVIHEPQPGVIPIRAAKRPKLRPWLYTDAPASIWLDGSYRVLSSHFAVDVLALADPLAQFPHPDRWCIYDEAPASLPIPKYAGEPITEQAEHYRAMGHPEQWGLWATSAVVRHHTPEVRKHDEAWAAEVEQWSTQDQVSQPYVLRNTGLRPSLLPGGEQRWPAYRFSRWLRLEASGKHL